MAESAGGTVRQRNAYRVGARIALLGASFKPDSDDVRVTDPQAADNARKRSADLTVVDTVAEAADDADAVLLLTEWRAYRELGPADLAGPVRHRRLIDGRNVLDPVRWRAAGWTYRAPGRPPLAEFPPKGGPGPEPR